MTHDALDSSFEEQTREEEMDEMQTALSSGKNVDLLVPTERHAADDGDDLPTVEEIENNIAFGTLQALAYVDHSNMFDEHTFLHIAEMLLRTHAASFSQQFIVETWIEMQRMYRAAC